MLVRSLFILVVTAQVLNADENCRTPDNEEGDCKPINKCQPLYSLLERRPITASTADYLRRSQCGFVGTYPKVCCPSGRTTITTNPPPVVEGPTENTDVESVTSNLLPGGDVCGLNTQSRIYGGEKTDLDEFPWMALIEYEKPGGSRGFYCGGVLISNKYILTAAHCVKGKDLPKTWKLVSVRLGEYNTETDQDCINNGFGEDCAPPPVNVPVVERIAHESYDPNDVNQYHDIALLRLKRSVTFSDYVRPICLPTSNEELRRSFIGQKLFVAGWGKTENRSESNIKLKVQVPVKQTSECSSTYRVANVRLGPGQMCAGGEKGRDSCRGDSGGPLMTVIRDKNKDDHWYAAGVVSFGPSPCGMENWPGVYTKVSKYVNWIVNKLKPYYKDGILENMNKHTNHNDNVSLRAFVSLNVFVTVVAVVIACTTPKGEQGDCRSLNHCQPLRSILERRPMSQEDNKYLINSICGYEGLWPKMCCPSNTFIVPKKPLLPDKDQCGIFTASRIFGGMQTELDEFPWMALLEYQKPNGKRKLLCGGVLISEKYVLTAAHCVKRRVMSNAKLISVRLGEYNTKTNPDCLGFGISEVCASPPVTVDVEEAIAYENFNPNNINQYDDIALLRLKASVNFTDFIKPICLPTTPEELNKSYIGRKLTVVGWGVTENGSESNVKLKVQLPVTNTSECISVYQEYNISLGAGQICAGGEKGKDSCRGDSGGPLMGASVDKEGDVHWYAVGIVSYGPTPCGMEGKPGVYTMVSKYVEWIISKLEP
nr:PREDICTED: uncharacterized protein LOC661375 [Tribolium castaneum]|eukprot:XP_015836792.1 PREDICTED: uncharacterized protein LOC661375 [Tribolium castaneum]